MCSNACLIKRDVISKRLVVVCSRQNKGDMERWVWRHIAKAMHRMIILVLIDLYWSVLVETNTNITQRLHLIVYLFIYFSQFHICLFRLAIKVDSVVSWEQITKAAKSQRIGVAQRRPLGFSPRRHHRRPLRVPSVFWLFSCGLTSLKIVSFLLFEFRSKSRSHFYILSQTGFSLLSKQTKSSSWAVILPLLCKARLITTQTNFDSKWTVA